MWSRVRSGASIGANTDTVAPWTVVVTYPWTMKGLRQLLSDSLQLFLRLSACNTTSFHQPTVIEESSHHHSCDHLAYQRDVAGDYEMLATMSPLRFTTKPSSYLQSSFDLTLREYSKQTEIDLIAHPFAVSLHDVNSLNTTIAALRERTRVSNDSKTDDHMAQLMSYLKSITHLVSLLSPREALSEHIDLVCHSAWFA
jgi:hypothetical protein